MTSNDLEIRGAHSSRFDDAHLVSVVPKHEEGDGHAADDDDRHEVDDEVEKVHLRGAKESEIRNAHLSCLVIAYLFL